jgi:hypothetical protein
VDQFGIVRPAPGVSPEYDNCIAQGDTPSPDGFYLTPPQVTDNAIYILGDAQLVSPGPAGVNRLEIAAG